MRWLAAVITLVLLTGCASKPIERDNAEIVMFGPARMRIHPVFTQVKDWNGDGKPDGIQAELEFEDQFSDPTKAAGKVMFELYAYRRGYPDPRGDRLVNPWVGSLLSLQEQYEHWNRTGRTYSFDLAAPQDVVTLRRSYVLTAMFEHSDGRRFFSQTILTGTDDLGINTNNVLTPPPPAPTTHPCIPDPTAPTAPPGPLQP